MKLLGLACGRKMGNCEILLKEALMSAEELGVEVEIVKGTLAVSGDQVRVHFPEEEQRRSRLTLEGKRIHFWEIADVQREFEKRMHEIPEKIEKYEAYKSYSRPQHKEV
ncbi:MAG: hypothetical protein JRJ03_19435 [Deltaproteobacteria bacterium]|nr:hypothetical protein [Deltaproteobacteria bacterium]